MENQLLLLSCSLDRCDPLGASADAVAKASAAKLAGGCGSPTSCYWLEGCGTVPTQHVGGNVLRVGGSPGDWRSAVLLAGVATQAVN